RQARRRHPHYYNRRDPYTSMADFKLRRRRAEKEELKRLKEEIEVSSDLLELNDDELMELKNEPDDIKLSVKIAKYLKEPKFRYIRTIIKKLGREKTIEIFKETINIQREGGMLRKDAQGNRTPGGVFFTLSKVEEED